MARIGTIVICLCLVGCFDSHDRGTAANPWEDCTEAAREGASDGEFCEFDGGCSAGPPRCGPSGGRACSPGVECVDGRLRVTEECVTCPPPIDGGPGDTAILWSSCDGWLRAGAGEGEPCAVESFGSCLVGGDECCTTSARCERGAVVLQTSCDDFCPEETFCPDYMPPPPGVELCRSDADCPSGVPCAPPGTPVCGGAGCEVLPVECESEDACGADEVCEGYRQPCACSLGARCVPDCRLRAGACTDGDSCDASTGTCRPTACTEGYECPPNTECVFGGVPADEHGCGRIACARDTDCECGACVRDGGPGVPGFCQSGPGFCAPPRP